MRKKRIETCHVQVQIPFVQCDQYEQQYVLIKTIMVKKKGKNNKRWREAEGKEKGIKKKRVVYLVGRGKLESAFAPND